jgi:hypothetical protein
MSDSSPRTEGASARMYRLPATASLCARRALATQRPAYASRSCASPTAAPPASSSSAGGGASGGSSVAMTYTYVPLELCASSARVTPPPAPPYAASSSPPPSAAAPPPRRPGAAARTAEV